jgi:Tn3 transposase DDE domain
MRDMWNLIEPRGLSQCGNQQLESAYLIAWVDSHNFPPFLSRPSDGQFFRSGKRGRHAGDVNARHGTTPGLSFYTHVSDQHGPYNIRAISATGHEAPFVLDGLMHHGSRLKINTHYTDTGGASDHVFILCRMLGFYFCPRLRDFPDRRLASIEPPARYGDLMQPIFGRRIRTDVIRDHWNEVVRLVASLQAGVVAPSVMLKKLAAYRRQNQLDLALQELGRIERTLFMLDWLESPDLRRGCHTGLNKSEQRHALAQAICTFHQGRDLHLPPGADRRAKRRGAAISGLRPEPRHRRDRLLELDIPGRCARPSPRLRRAGAGRVTSPYLATELGAHQPVGRFLVGTGRGLGHRAAFPQPRVTPGRRLIG